jgi:hypothetical protein
MYLSLLDNSEEDFSPRKRTLARMSEINLRFFGGGGGSVPDPPPVEKPVETRRIVEQAGEEREAERKRVPPGRKATVFAGIEKMLKERLGK